MTVTCYNLETYKADRALHHVLALGAYRQSFEFQNFTEKHRDTTFRRLNDVFTLVQIGDPNLPSIKRQLDTFDLTNPLLASKILAACKRDLPTKARVKACFKAIRQYCLYLQACPVVHLEGQPPLDLTVLYGQITCPINRYSLPRDNQTKPPNFNYLTYSEYKCWLKFTSRKASEARGTDRFLKACQLHLLCVLAGEMGLRSQELMGLELQHLNLVDDVCFVVKGKGSRGSGYRKREVPISPLAKATLWDFLKCFPRTDAEPLFQNESGERLSLNTARGWLRDLIGLIQREKLSIFLAKGFGWHAFRRTFARNFIDRGGNIHELKRICGWSYTSTLSHYLGAPKPTLPQKGLPLKLRAS